MKRHSYPPAFESFWLDRARALIGADISGLEADVARLSDLFTIGREKHFGDYAQDERLLAAYGLFYFPQTYERIQFPLRELLERGLWTPDRERPVSLLDLGAGAGGALFGAAAALHQEGYAVSASALESSGASLAALRALLPVAGLSEPRLDVDTHLGDLRNPRSWPDGSWDLILSSFAVNEAFHGEGPSALEGWTMQALGRLNPGGVLLIVEPALEEASSRLQTLRNTIAASEDAAVLAPCLHRSACPLLAEAEMCHDVRAWSPPESLVRLNRRLYREVRHLKFSFLALARRAPREAKAAGERFRLVAPVIEQKGRLLTAGCAGSGEKRTYEIQTRGLNKGLRKDFVAADRGEVWESEISPVKGGGGAARLAMQEVARLNR